VKWEWEEYSIGIQPLLLLRRYLFWLFPPHRPREKKLMTAGLTPQHRKSQNSPEEGHHTWYVFRGNALQFEVAADPAMRINNVAQR
jgi:hypothetical protein